MNEFQLIISVIAIVISTGSAIYTIKTNLTLSSSDYRLSEQVKADTASLVATLRSLMTKSTWAMLGDQMDIDFEKERINEFVNSPTGFAYYRWAAEKDQEAGEGVPEPWRIFFQTLSKLTNHEDNPEAVHGLASRLEKVLASLRKEDLETIKNYYADLTKMIAGIRDSQQGNVFVHLAQENQENGAKDPDQTEIVRKLNFLKNEREVSDPTLELFLAVYEGNLEAAKMTLDNGADMNLPIGKLLSKYENMLRGMGQ